MIGIDGATVARPHGQTESLNAPLPGEFAEFESEFFVEWQVADRACSPHLPEKQILFR